MNNGSVARALTIAGSDSGGGAGIQADLKTFTALGVYGASAITAITAQNTVGVAAVYEVPAALVARQIDVVAQDIGVDAAKTGMLSSATIIDAVAESVQRNRIERLVVDPVMTAKSGDALLETSAREVLARRLLPLALVVTPNLAEAQTLSGRAIRDARDMREAARAIHGAGARWVLVKGGHVEGPTATDLLFDGSQFLEFSAERIETPNTHGTGCTYSAAIAAELAKGRSVPEAVRRAKSFVTGAIRHAFALGAGHGPLNHFWAKPGREGGSA